VKRQQGWLGRVEEPTREQEAKGNRAEGEEVLLLRCLLAAAASASSV
jgi:hypothetical protein